MSSVFDFRKEEYEFIANNQSFRELFACKVCGNWPDEEGSLNHGKGCYTQSEDGGGDECLVPEMVEMIREKKLIEKENGIDQ